MESKRQRQVAEMIKRNISIEPLVTVTEVHPTPDLSQAKIYVSIWNTDNKQAVILNMNSEHQRLKAALANRLKRHIRRIPAISFFIDETLDEMTRVETMFDKLYDSEQMPVEKEDE
jgi:ribosome-binding factor A